MAEKYNIGVVLSLSDQLSAKLISITSKLNSFGKNISSIGNKMTLGMTVPMTVLGGYAIKTAISMESAWAGVAKTVNASSSELQKLKNDLNNLGRVTPVPIAGLYGIAAAAGQLGIKNENIISFTKNIAGLAVATNLTSDEAAISLAKFTNIVGESQENFGKMASTIVALGNNSATMESDIVSFSMRIAAAGRGAKMTTPQILGISAAMSSLGLTSAEGGTSISKLINTLGIATSRGGKDLNTIAKISQVSAEEFKQAWQKDAVGALTLFIKGIDDLKQRPEYIADGLDQLGLSGSEVTDVVRRMAGGVDLFTKAQIIQNESWEKGVALQKETAVRYGTTASQLITLKNRTDLLGESYGTMFLPAIRNVINRIDPLIQWLGKLDTATKGNLILGGMALAAQGPILKGVGYLISGFTALAKVVGGIALLPFPQKIFLTGAIVGVTFVIKNWDTVRTEWDKTLIKMGTSWDFESTRFDAWADKVKLRLGILSSGLSKFADDYIKTYSSLFDFILEKMGIEKTPETKVATPTTAVAEPSRIEKFARWFSITNFMNALKPEQGFTSLPIPYASPYAMQKDRSQDNVLSDPFYSTYAKNPGGYLEIVVKAESGTTAKVTGKKGQKVKVKNDTGIDIMNPFAIFQGQ